MQQSPAMGAAFLLLLVLVGAIVVWLWRTRRLGDLVERTRDAAAPLFPARPISRRALPRRLLRAAEHTVTIGVSGTVLVPSRIDITAHPDDLEPFTDALEWLQRDITEAMLQRAKDNGWAVPEGPHVTIAADPERPVGAPRARGRIGAFRPEDVRTLVRTDQPVEGAENEPTAHTAAALPSVEDVTTTPQARIVHLRLVATDAAADDLSAVVASTGTPLVLGRSREADLQVKDRQVSGRHCAFSVDQDAGDLVVQDLESTNGTFLDGEQVERTTLPAGGTLRVGGCTWRVEIDELATQE